MFKLYVGNLATQVTSDDLVDLFKQYGEVKSCNVITDRYTGESRGFAFIEMENKDEGEKAIEELNGVELEGRNLKVNIARSREQRGGGRNFRNNNNSNYNSNYNNRRY